MVNWYAGSSDQIDDVVQETFLRFYRPLDRFRFESSLGTYLKRLAINQALDLLPTDRKRSLSLFPEAAMIPITICRSRLRGHEYYRSGGAGEAWCHRAIHSFLRSSVLSFCSRMIDGCSTRDCRDC